MRPADVSNTASELTSEISCSGASTPRTAVPNIAPVPCAAAVSTQETTTAVVAAIPKPLISSSLLAQLVLEERVAVMPDIRPRHNRRYRTTRAPRASTGPGHMGDWADPCFHLPG